MLVNISDAMLGTESIYLEVGVEITQRKMKVDCFLVAPSLPVHGVMPMKVDGNQTLLQDIITVNPECYTINHSSPPQSPGSRFREDLLDDGCRLKRVGSRLHEGWALQSLPRVVNQEVRYWVLMTRSLCYRL
jgi:hypothetical protein